MTPETLKQLLIKKLAEALGYEPVIENNTIKVEIDYTPLGYDEKGGGLFVGFNPESNPAHREEVLLWLLGKGWKLIPNGDEYEFVNYGKSQGRWYSCDKDYTTALMMAAEKELLNA